jgi:FAD/FMN-containing dehydrogenase
MANSGHSEAAARPAVDDDADGVVGAVRPPLPHENLELVEGWGLSTDAPAYVFRPSTIEGIRRTFEEARASGRTVGLRGAGRSYGDASLNCENIILDLTRFSRILSWDPDAGIITVESGVTIKQLWEYILPDGWWPPVVPGTMFPTLGGCAGMNIHGKNNFKVGPIGEHILSFDLMLPSGEIVHATPEENSDIFYSAIGGFGMLGCFITLTLRMKKVYSGQLEVEPINAGSLDEMIEIFVRELDRSDYLVGWIDAFATGKKLGRGQIHKANYLPPGADPNPAQTLRLENQQLPDTIFGLLPKSILWRFMRPFMNNIGTRFINAAKYRSSALLDRGKTFRQAHAAFAFLLDYVPNWKRSYGPGGLIQYQSFVPEATAAAVFKAQLELARAAGHPPYLAVFKRHRRDRFLMSHAVDGYSLALDFKITKSNREEVWNLAHRFDELVLEGGGRFYFAKDSTLEPPSVRRYLGDETVDRFMELKKRCDPEEILQTNLYRRLFRDSGAGKR